MALRITPNPRAAGRLSIAANQNARMSSIFSVDWDHVTSKPDVIGTIVSGATSGYLLQANGVGSDATFEGFLQSGSGATERSWQSKVGEYLSVKDFGATGDGSTNDTAAINLAVAAAYTAGKAVYFPAGTYRVDESSSGSGYALLNKGISMFGEGITSVIAPLSTMPSTADILKILPEASSDRSFMRLQNFFIYPAYSGAAKGKRAIYGDFSNATNIGEMLIEGVYCASGNDYSLYLANVAATNTQGVPAFCTLIQRNLFYSGTYFDNVGDSVLVRGNTIRGSNIGIRVSQVHAGGGTAACFLIDSNNIDAEGGAISFLAGNKPIIVGNNIELSAGAGSNAAAVDISGAEQAVVEPVIRDNNISIFGTATATIGLRIADASYAIVEGNRLVAGISVATGLSITAAASNATVSSNTITGFTGAISDSGTNTRYGFPSGTQANFTPESSDGAALGTASKMWSDLFLASGAIINFNAGDVTITHIANTLAFAGASSGYAFDAIIYPNTNDGAALGSGSNAFSDLFLADGGVINFNNGDVTITHAAANTLAFAGASSGYAFDAIIYPTSNDGAALGSGSNSFSDLFLASGGVINWNNGDVTATHSANGLAFAGASNGYTFDAAVKPASSDGAALGSTTLQWSDAFFASGAVLNFVNGAETITHSSNQFEITGAGLKISGTDGSSNQAVFAGGAVIVKFEETSVENWFMIADGGQFDFRPTSLGTTSIFQLTTSLVAFTVPLQTTGSMHAQIDDAIPAGGTAGMGYRFSSATNFGVFFGSGAPSLSAAQGSLYLRSDGSSTSTRLYVNTNGSTTWTNVTTAA